jgi:uroporphyrinogen-III synthase
MSTSPGLPVAPFEENKADRSESSLTGWRVVVTRAEEQADSLSERLRGLGAIPLPYPTISFVPPDDMQPLDQALRQAMQGDYDWLILTSVNAVKAVRARLNELGYSAPVDMTSPPFRLAAVGPTTMAACQELLGIAPAVVPKKFVAEALAEAMGPIPGQRVLLANADIARPILQKLLQQAGATVDRVVAYCTVPATGGEDIPRLLSEGRIDAITFTSGSTIRSFIDRIGPKGLEHARTVIIACIGPVAAKTAQESGLPPTIVASTYTEEGLVEALLSYARTTG